VAALSSPLDQKFWLLLAALAVAWAVVSMVALALGAVGVEVPQLLEILRTFGRPADPEVSGLAAIVWEVRLPRVLLGGLAGLGLAVAGVAWQGVLRNPLADPYLIGASAGGALGAGLAILFGVGPAGFALPLLAFLGSIASVALVVRLAMVPGRGISVERLLLAGVAVSSFLSAVLSLASFVKSESFTQLYFWLVGGLSGRGWEQLTLVAPYAAVAIAGLLWITPRLNVLQLGDETAHGLGIDVARDQRVAIGLAALLTAAIVSVCGMIGFVGLVVPHLARMLVGPDLRRLLPVAALLGAVLLVTADMGARLLWAPVEVPVGVFTAMLGAPFFLFLLMRQKA
jgi:iron complex transport system permease protein